MHTLQILHWVAAVLHTGQAITLFTLIADLAKEPQFPLSRIGYRTFLEDKRQNYELSWFLPMFSALSSVNHILTAANTSYFNQVMKSKLNWIRWVEYSISASLMIWVVSVLSGITELRTLISLVILNVALQMCGLMIDKMKADGASKVDLLAWSLIAWGIHNAMWTQIFISFYTVVDVAKGVPDAVKTIVPGLFVLHSLFGLAQSLYVFDVIDHPAYEGFHIGLSLAAKTFLSWFVFQGVVRDNNAEFFNDRL